MNEKNDELPEDLGIRFGSKLEAKWTELKDKIEAQMVADEINKKVDAIHEDSNRKVLELANKEIELEKEKFK